jgi:ribonuclease J
MEIDETKFVNWLDFFKVTYDSEIKDKRKIFARRHVSGHASKSELKELIEKIDPAKIIPIHTTESNIFEEMFPDKTILPRYAQAIEI